MSAGEMTFGQFFSAVADRHTPEQLHSLIFFGIEFQIYGFRRKRRICCLKITKIFFSTSRASQPTNHGSEPLNIHSYINFILPQYSICPTSILKPSHWRVLSSPNKSSTSFNKVFLSK